MSGSRMRSPWWALFLPVAMLVGWLASNLGASGRSAGAHSTEESLLVPEEPSRPPLTVRRGYLESTEQVRPPADVPEREENPLFSAWTTYDVALVESRSSGKPILLAFSADWSESSQALRREVFVHEAAGTTVKAAVIPVSIVDRAREDEHNSPQVEALQRRFRVEEFPTLVILSPATGRTVRRSGYMGMQETLRWITDGAIAVVR